METLRLCFNIFYHSEHFFVILNEVKESVSFLRNDKKDSFTSFRMTKKKILFYEKTIFNTILYSFLFYTE